jgi:phosphatidylglycerophosphatase A
MKRNFLSKIICTALGLGLTPRAPGTFGALGGLAVGFAILQAAINPVFTLLVLIILFFFIGVYCSGRLIPEWGKDPPEVVIDEVVGMWISMLFLPNNIGLLLSAFLAFRFFDIVKPGLIRKAEKIQGGWGIMLDDVVAGIFTNATIHFYIFIKFCMT